MIKREAGDKVRDQNLEPDHRGHGEDSCFSPERAGKGHELTQVFTACLWLRVGNKLGAGVRGDRDRELGDRGGGSCHGPAGGSGGQDQGGATEGGEVAGLDLFRRFRRQDLPLD